METPYPVDKQHDYLVMTNILTSELGAGNYNFSRIMTGETHEVYRVTRENESFFFKLVKNPNESGVYKQTALFPKLQSKQIPVPRRLINLTQISKDVGYVIDEWVNAEAASTIYGMLIQRPLNPQLNEDLQTNLINIHSIIINGYGDIDRTGVGKYKSWQNYIKSVINPEKIDSARSTIIPISLLERGENFILGEFIPSYTEEARLIHGDFNLKNILLMNKNLAYIVDWDDALAGDPLWEYARMHLWFDDIMPIYNFIVHDNSIILTPDEVVSRVKYYKAILSIKEAIDHVNKTWAPDTWRRMDSALSEINY